MLSKEEIEEKISKIPYWGHTITLPHGVTTPGILDNRHTLKTLHLPENLSGKRVLDIGTWDGFFAFECERRGAEVVAIDNLERLKNEEESGQEFDKNTGFFTVKEILQSRVEYHNYDICDIKVRDLGKFDIVLFLGVIYHLKNPMAALENIAGITDDLLILESEVLIHPDRMPYLLFCKGRTYNDDPTNWFIPNANALKDMVVESGFSVVKEMSRTSHRNIKDFFRYGYLSGRIVLHAHKIREQYPGIMTSE